MRIPEVGKRVILESEMLCNEDLKNVSESKSEECLGSVRVFTYLGASKGASAGADAVAMLTQQDLRRGCMGFFDELPEGGKVSGSPCHPHVTVEKSTVYQFQRG